MTDLSVNKRITELRAACIHGRYEAHRFEMPDGEWAKWESCPGGWEVIIDYEVMRNTFWAHAVDLLQPQRGSVMSQAGIERALDLALAAAIGGDAVDYEIDIG